MANKNTPLRNKMVTDFGALFNGQVFEIREGITTLALFTLPDPAFTNSATGTITLNGLPIEVEAAATGTADTAELRETVQGYILGDLTVGLSNANVVLDNLSIQAGQVVRITAFSYTEPESVI